MPIIDEETAAEVAEVARAVKSAAQEVVGEQVERHKARRRSSSKTRKSVATRERIMTAASQLMVEHGSTDFQMSEVSARCHMSKGALYYYFADRDELIQAIFASETEDLVSTSSQIVAQAPSALEALRDLCSEFAGRMRTGSPLALAMTRELSYSSGGVLSSVSRQFAQLIKIVAAQLERAKAEGTVRQDVDAELAAVYSAGAFLVTSLVAASSEGFGSREGLAGKLYSLCMQGIGLPGAAEGEGADAPAAAPAAADDEPPVPAAPAGA